MAKKTLPKSEVQTIEITNFGGRLTRIINGDLNSGFAKFNNSWGYDPFSKPMNLTWFEQPVEITGPITDTVVAAKKFFGGSGIGFNNVQQYVLLLGNGNGGNNPGNLYVMQPNQTATDVSSSILANVDSVLGSTSVTGTFNFGGSMEIFTQPSIAGIGGPGNGTAAVYIGSDTKISTVPLGSILGTQRNVSGNFVGTINNATGAFRPLKIFQGLLRFGNGNTIATIGATGTIVSLYQTSIRGVANANSDLQTPLPVDCEIQDMDVSVDGNYLSLATSKVDNEQIAILGQDVGNAAANESTLYGWNGADPNITTENTMPSGNLTALQTYLGNNVYFTEDSFGSALSNGVNKLLTLPNNKAPWANGTAVNGNFLTWICPEFNQGKNGSFASMYYFGSLDQENPSGLYRVMRQTTNSAFVYNTPLNLLVDNYYTTVNSPFNFQAGTLGYGKHYFSLIYPNFGSGTTSKLYRFLINPTGTGTPQAGVYETQTQLFSKRIGISQIRVYTEPVVAGNGFRIDIVDANGNPVTNGTFNYVFGDPADKSVRINFNPNCATLYSFGLRITNTGTTNMTFKKIEVDYTPEGK